MKTIFISFIIGLLLFNPLKSQTIKREVISLSEALGDTISLEERNKYKLFLFIEDFQSAILYKTADDNYYFEISYLDEITKDEKKYYLETSESKINRIKELLESDDEPLQQSENKIQQSKRVPSTLWHLKISNGDTITNVLLRELKDDSLLIIHEGNENLIHINSIVKIYSIRESSFWDGAKIGGMVGAGAGILGGLFFSKKGGGVLSDPGIYKPAAAIGGGISYGIIGALLGGGISSLAGIDEVHDFSEMNMPLKKHFLKSLILRE